MIIDFQNMTFDEIKKLVPDATQPWLLENKLFFEGDHWQDGAGWVGPRLDVADPSYAAVMKQIKDQFISKNIVREVIKRHISGILSDDPTFDISTETLGETETPPAELPTPPGTPAAEAPEDPLVIEARDLISRWWSSQQCLVDGIDGLSSPRQALGKAIENALLSKRGPMRLFIPQSSLITDEDENGEITVSLPELAIDDAIQRIFLHVPAPEQSTVGVDSDSLLSYGLYISTDPDTSVETIEISYQDPSGTILMVRRTDSSQFEQTVLGLDGRLVHYEVTLDLLITEQVRQAQKAFNMIRTMMSRNIVQAGFLERVILNAQLPGRSTVNPRTGEAEFVPEDLQTGPGVTTFVAGIEYEDAAGNTHYTDPDVVYREPVNVEMFEKSASAIYAGILEETRQSFVRAVAESNISEGSRRQARSDFEASLNDTQAAIEPALEWLAETVLRLAAIISGQQTKFDNVNVSATTYISTGPLTPDEEKSVIDLVDAKLTSRRTGMSKLGIRDVDDEIDQIDEEQAQKQAQNQANLALAFLNAENQAGRGNVPTETTPPVTPTTPATEVAGGPTPTNFEGA